VLLHLFILISLLRSDKPFVMYIGVVVGAMIAVVSINISKYFDSSATNDIIIGALIRSGLVPYLLAALLLVLFYRVFGLRFSHHSNYLLVLVCLSLGFSFASNPVLNGSPIRGSELSDSDYTYSLGSAQEKELGHWISTNTSLDSVFATNYFCGMQCQGAEWYVDNPSSAGSSFLLPVLSGRRFLIQGSRFLGGDKPPNWVLERMDASLSFGLSQSVVNQDRLVDVDVDYFVFDRSFSHLNNSSITSAILFENERFQVVSLISGFDGQ
jgi:hypothetical protein